MLIRTYEVTFKSFASGREWTEKIYADGLYSAVNSIGVEQNPNNIIAIKENGISISSEKLTELFDSLAARSTV